MKNLSSQPEYTDIFGLIFSYLNMSVLSLIKEKISLESMAVSDMLPRSPFGYEIISPNYSEGDTKCVSDFSHFEDCLS